MLKIVNNYKEPTKEAKDLKNALEKQGVIAYLEVNDGFKSIDIGIPKAKINVEVDGIPHLTNPHQILADLGRGYYSHKKGYDTMHIPNEMIHKHLEEISKALAEASKIRERKIHIHISENFYMKTLKFTTSLVPLILSGEKTSTWRLFDDKNLQKSDELIFIEKETGKEFAKAAIVSVSERRFTDLTDADWQGHERFESEEKMYEAYKKYYKLEVIPSTILKVIHFKLHK